MRQTNKCIVTTIALLASVAFAGTASAQGSNTGTPAILEALNNLAAQVTALQNSVNALQAGEQVNYRFTPVLLFKQEVARCNAVNVTAEPRTVRATLIGRSGNTIQEDQATLPPGNTSNFIGITSSVYAGYLYCRFTVTDGVKADIRGSLEFTAFSNNQSILSVPAE